MIANASPQFCSPLPLGVIRATGADAALFVHNLLTNDIQNLAPGLWRFAGLCTPKGRLIASMHCWRSEENIWLIMSQDILPSVLKKMSMYVLRSKVKLVDASSEFIISGQINNENSAPAPGQVLTTPEGGFILRLDAQRLLHLSLLSTTLNQAFDVSSATNWLYQEIIAGQPRIVAATQEMFVPQMLNFETSAVAGISFSKGCYPGQEIVARTQYLGKVKRHLYRVTLGGEALANANEMSIDKLFAAGAPLYAPESSEQACGNVVLTSPVPNGDWIGLAVIQQSCAEAGAIYLNSVTKPLPLKISEV